MIIVAVYRSKPNTHTAPGGYWFLRVMNTTRQQMEDAPITSKKAEEFMAIGVPQIADGGGT